MNHPRWQCTFSAVWFLRFCVVVPGDAQEVCVFNSVGVLWLRSAGWTRIFNSAYWDAGQGSAGVELQSGDPRADDRHNQPVKPYTKLHGAVTGQTSGGKEVVICPSLLRIERLVLVWFICMMTDQKDDAITDREGELKPDGPCLITAEGFWFLNNFVYPKWYFWLFEEWFCILAQWTF